MKVETFEPKSEILKKYIKSFYFLTHSENEEKVNYFVFPNTINVLSVYKNVFVNRIENRVVFEGNKNHSFASILYVKFDSPLFVTYSGNIDCISIMFKPLGINAFLDKNLADYVIDEHTTTFEPFDDFEFQMALVFAENSTEQRLQKFEHYLLSELKGFHHPFLNQVLEAIESDENQELSLLKIASKSNITSLTLNRHFEKHIGRTPSKYRKIVRFRKAMAQHANKNESENLIDIAYALQYFDQSHMIKDFKNLTHHNPKDFFRNLDNAPTKNMTFIYPKK